MNMAASLTCQKVKNEIVKNHLIFEPQQNNALSMSDTKDESVNWTF